MSITLGNRGGSPPEINVTPMIDVLLVLLIIFMVLFPYTSTGERAEIPQPSTKTTGDQPNKPIVIQIKQEVENGRPSLKINEENVTWENLGLRLVQISALRSDKTAFLKGDPEVTFQYVAEVIDTAHHAGVERLGLMGK